jgi:hypothetical protein
MSMNPRNVHELMKAFPRVDAHVRDWCNLVERDGALRTDVLARLIDSHIRGHDLLVWVSRKIGGYLPKDEAIQFIAEHIGQGEIKIADRQFSGFVVVAMSGVGTGWQHLSPGLNDN